MTNPYEHIHFATNTRLAEMLKEAAIKQRKAIKKWDSTILRDYVEDRIITEWKEHAELLDEASRRLEAFDRQPKFDYEQSE